MKKSRKKKEDEKKKMFVCKTKKKKKKNQVFQCFSFTVVALFLNDFKEKKKKTSEQ